MQLKLNIKRIKKSGLFDAKYYIETYSDIKEAGIDPLKHFVEYGWKEGRNPCAKFDTNFYLLTYPDVASVGMNPLAHYILHGKKEGRRISSSDFTTLRSKKISRLKKLVGLALYAKKNPHLVKKFIQELQYGGLSIALQKTRNKLSLNANIDKESLSHPIHPLSTNLTLYDAWLQVNQLNTNQIEYLLSNLNTCSNMPLISIIMPVYNPSLLLLEQAIESVQTQIYTKWEICIVDDASTNTFVKPYIENLAKHNSNIKFHFSEKNAHISATTNKAVDMANGEYLIFLDQDDVLTPDALIEVVLHINKHSSTDLMYSDDDKIDLEGNYFAPQFKPDWSPEYLLSFMYCSHLKCVKKSLYEEVGGFRLGFEGSQDYDFYLRASEKANNIVHIPKILYHWRVIPGSTAAGGNEKNYSFQAGVNAVQEALNRRQVKGIAYQPKWALENGNGIYAIDFPDEGKTVGIIIPTKNGLDLLKRCITSLKATTYKNYTIYVIDNDSDCPKTLTYLENLHHCKILKISSPNKTFSFSYINNRAVELIDEELVLFLNNDTEVINPKWLSQMVGYLQFDGVGSVGARLLFPDNRIQHAGIIHGIDNGFPITSGRLLPKWDWGYMAATVTSKNFAAVTAACMLTPRKLFLKLNGFDESDFNVAFNDCDYGYKLYQSGYRNVLAPEAELFHHEGVTRGDNDKPAEEAAYIRKYINWKDPYYNPNLATNCSDYTIDAKSVVLHKIPKFRLLMITHNLNLEGAPRSFYELAKELKRKGAIEPVVISHSAGPLLDLYEDEGIEVTIIDGFNLFSMSNTNQINQFLQRMTDMIVKLNIDVVYGNTIETFWGMQCAKKINIPSVWNIRESENPFSSYNHNLNIKTLMIDSLQYPYKVVFVANATKVVYEPLNTQYNFMTIHNGFDQALVEKKIKGIKPHELKTKLGIKETDLIVLIVGTVCDRKGQMDLIKAIELLDTSAINNMSFIIVGDRKSLEYSKNMHAFINKLSPNKKEKIIIIDETHDTHLYYMIADIFVCSSRIESFPKVIQEAMYYKLAIITTPVYGIVEQVKNNISALYYDPANIEQLARHLQSLYHDSKLLNHLSENAKIALDTLPTLAEMSADYEIIFQEAYLSGGSR